MSTINNDKTVYLNSPDDWEAWNLQLQFQAQAVSLRGASIELAEGDDGAESSSTNQITVADLTADGFKTFQLEWTIHQARQKEYTQQDDEVKRLKQWILKTVSTHYQLTSCDPIKPFTEWYSTLKTQAGISDDKAMFNAREAYRLAVNPLTKAPKDLIKWSETWEQALSMAQRKKVPEAMTTRTWFHDFTDAVKPVMDNWVTAYKLAKQAQVGKLTLNYREVASDFREEVRQSTRARTPGGYRVARGAFGPSFAAKEGKAHQEDAFDDEIGSGSERGARKRRRADSPEGERPNKRAMPEADLGTANGSESTCLACGGRFHHLSKCFYVFPDTALMALWKRSISVTSYKKL
ncbi:hypothetical protein QBC46DRAFT_150174 [Diplogelasinospora grovesii]|uniref:Gag protein n=1 Tax=Diplogelasinospora grovesii TaxID=303347 RepID=A0AAN6S469_9PEZI|nr:hypothetical protein QBC46DRAFT_150174 [Diplogelasinospora grovesii]